MIPEGINQETYLEVAEQLTYGETARVEDLQGKVEPEEVISAVEAIIGNPEIPAEVLIPKGGAENLDSDSVIDISGFDQSSYEDLTNEIYDGLTPEYAQTAAPGTRDDPNPLNSAEKGL